MGTIYHGTGWSKTAIGECDGGTIYKGTGWSKTAVGEYDNGTIYEGTGWNKTAVGEYDISPAAAAALLLLLGGNNGGGISDSKTGILRTIFDLICLIVIAILKIMPRLYAYFMFPVWAGVTIYCFIGSLLFIIFGLAPISFAFGIAATVLFFISIPYWFILFIQKHKQKLKWKQTFKYYVLWFVKGPLAYKDIKELKNRTYNNKTEE